MPTEFEEFAQAASRTRTDSEPAPARISRVAVLGGGPDARLLAGLALAAGCDVTLFSAYAAELELLRRSSGIGLRDAGPVGTYHVDRTSGPSVRLTVGLDVAVQGAEAVFLTGPIHKQRTYAMVLAEHLSDGQTLVVAPGRSLGAVETAWMLRLGGCRVDITVVELLGLPFWYRAQGANLSLSEAGPQLAATLPRRRGFAISALSGILGPLPEAESVLSTGFADLSAAVEIPALTLGGAGLDPGGVKVPMGGMPLPENESFAGLIGSDQHALISALAGERRTVAHAFGVRNLPETGAWIAMFAGEQRDAGARPVPNRDLARMLMRDGVIGSLVPLTSAAALAGVSVPCTDALISVTGVLLGADVAAAGRRLETIGVTEGSADAARLAIDALTPGGG